MKHQTTKLAKSIAKQIAQEPIEILKDVKEQALGLKSAPESEDWDSAKRSEQDKKLQEQQSVNDQLKSSRTIEALNRELSDIRKGDLFKDLQEKITNGEEVYVDEYPELSIEQKQVLKAQMEVVRNQKQAQASGEKQFNEPAVKKGRQLFNFGKKTAMKREQTHVEKPVPPSG